jgi:hypothetical protein
LPATSKLKLPEDIKLFDADNNLVEEMNLPITDIAEWPRTVVFMDKKYQEGGPDSFYKLGEFYEVQQ